MEFEEINGRILKEKKMNKESHNPVIVTQKELEDKQKELEDKFPLIDFKSLNSTSKDLLKDETFYVLRFYQPISDIFTKQSNYNNNHEYYGGISISVFHQYITNKIVYSWLINNHTDLQNYIRDAHNKKDISLNKITKTILDNSKSENQNVIMNVHCVRYKKENLENIYNDDNYMTLYGRYCPVLKVWFIFSFETYKWYVSFVKPSETDLEKLKRERAINWLATVYVIYLTNHICFNYNTPQTRGNGYPLAYEQTYSIEQLLANIKKVHEVLYTEYEGKAQHFTTGIEPFYTSILQFFKLSLKRENDTFNPSNNRLLESINLEPPNSEYDELYVTAYRDAYADIEVNPTYEYSFVGKVGPDTLGPQALAFYSQSAVIMELYFYKNIAIWNYIFIQMNNKHPIVDFSLDKFGILIPSQKNKKNDNSKIKEETEKLTEDYNKLSVNTFTNMLGSFIYHFFPPMKKKEEYNDIYKLAVLNEFNLLEVYFKFYTKNIDFNSLKDEDLKKFTTSYLDNISERNSIDVKVAHLTIFDIYILHKLYKKYKEKKNIIKEYINAYDSALLTINASLLKFIRQISYNICEVVNNDDINVYDMISKIKYDNIKIETDLLKIPRDIDYFIDYNIFTNAELSKKLVFDLYQDSKLYDNRRKNKDNILNVENNSSGGKINEKTANILSIIKKIDDEIVYTTSNYQVHKDHLKDIEEYNNKELFSELLLIKRKLWMEDLISINLLDIYFLIYRYTDILKHINTMKTVNAYHNYISYFNATQLTDFYYETLSDITFTSKDNKYYNVWSKIYEKISMQLSFNKYPLDKILNILKAISNVEDKENNENTALIINKKNIISTLITTLHGYIYDVGKIENIENSIEKENTDVIYIDLRTDKKKDNFKNYIKLTLYDWKY